MIVRLTHILAVAVLLAACKGGNKSSDDSPSKSDEDEEASSIADVDECASYIKKVEECGDSTLDSRKEAVEKQLAKSKRRSIVRKFCENMEKVYTCRRKPTERTSTENPKNSDAALGIKECDDYLARLTECGEDDQFVGMSRKGFQIKLDEGKSRATIARGCETLLKVYRCKNK
jgi:hypothetical protein